MNYLQAHRVRCLLPVPLMTSAELRRGLGNDKCPTQPAGKWDGMGHLTYILWISYGYPIWIFYMDMPYGFADLRGF